MTTSVSDGVSQALSFDLTTAYSVDRPSRIIVHDIIGSPDPAVTLQPAGLRTGRWQAIIGTDDALATKWDLLLNSGRVLVLADSDKPRIGMVFVVTDASTLSLDTDDGTVWLIEFGFQEVAR
ncbi:hypothetical protein GCM10027515_26550 [Schumannella luteola]|uniref:Uncharacterized protein n=1 Tax=Schumannella luteola TaxID=472059 RepID=A0A852YK50_9MICO|nr:hypothetical protein [Schumannella luteola]NYG99548.1 hypothetical protein [Schumannella luteola]TPX03865.1 hypothetical protein FJ656_15145 [Schumannella luteola]